MSTQLLVALGAALLLAWFFWMLRRGRGNLAEGMREYVSTDAWGPFRAGYLAALEDTQQVRRPSVQEDAERAFRSRYIERQPRR